MKLFYNTTFFSIAYLIILTGSIVIGYLYAHRSFLRKNRAWRSNGIESAIIGFYGLLLSFILLMAGNSNKERNNLIHQHMNALEGLYQKSVFMSDVPEQWMKSEILTLIQLKQKLKTADADKVENVFNESEREHAKMWSRLKAMKGMMERQDLDEIVELLSATVSMHQQIRLSYEERTPIRLIIVLLVGSWLVGLLIGFMSGINVDHNFLVPLIFFILTYITILTIHDLDNPTSGLIKPSFQGYDILKQVILNSK
jgi:hypothetical protein